MARDPDLPKNPPATADDGVCTEDAKRVVEDYASGLREILRKLRKLITHDLQ